MTLGISKECSWMRADLHQRINGRKGIQSAKSIWPIKTNTHTYTHTHTHTHTRAHTEVGFSLLFAFTDNADFF